MNVACSICLESFTLTSDIYSTPCGHVFHCHCIQKWLKTGNQYCTHCRQNCTINEITKLHFSENESALEENYVATKLESENQKLQQEVDALKARELEANKKCNQLELENVILQQKVNASKWRELGSKQKFADLKEENKKLHTAFCQGRSNCAGMDRVLKMQRRKIYNKSQKIAELEAKCNQILGILRKNGSVSESISDALVENNTAFASSNFVSATLTGSGNEGEIGSSSGGTGSNPLAYLRNHEQFQQMKRVLQQNPGMLKSLLQNIGQSNPELLQIISQNKEAFIRLINESDDESTSGSDSMF